MTKKKTGLTVCFDFDGVIHSYRSGWQGDESIIPDPMVFGIGKVIRKLKADGYKIVIFTTRARTKEGFNAVCNYLKRRHIPFDSITDIKPPALCYIDDRAINFDGDCESLYPKIVGFKSWVEK